MSNSQNDKGDWGEDSLALFRGARGAHDPTPAERARIERVLMRLQAGSPLQPSAAMRSGRASRGATPTTLIKLAKVSLAMLGVAAAYLALGRTSRDSSAALPSAPPAVTATARAALPSSVPPAEPDVLEPASPPRAKSNAVQPTRVARREDEPPARGTPRRLRASTGRQRPPKNDGAALAEEPHSTAEERSSSAVQQDATQADSPQRRSTSTDEGVTRESTGREGSPEPSMQPVARAARTATAAPQDPGTELAILKRMQAALRERDFKTVLALCAEHQRRWPHGSFELEREGVHAIASCGISSDDALPLAKRFLADHPHASLAMRVSSACRRQLQQGH